MFHPQEPTSADRSRGLDSTLPHSLLWSLLLAAGVCHVGFSFLPWGWPAIDGYPIIERFLDPGFLREDFYTNTAVSYNVDTTQAYLFGGIDRMLGVPYAVSIAVVNLLRCLFFPALLFGFFRVLSGQIRLAIWATALGTVANFALPKTVGWAWVWGDPSTAMFAVFATTWGWKLALERKLFSTSIAFAIAALIHPLTTVHGLVVLAAICLVDFSREEQLSALRSPRALIGGAIFAVAFLSQYWLLAVGTNERLSTQEYVEIIARIRHPGDYLPSRFTRSTTVAFLLTMSVVAATCVRLRQTIPRYRLVATVLAIYACVCVAGYLFVELIPVRFFVQLIPYRMANVGAPFCLFVLAAFLTEQLRQERFWSASALIAAFVVPSPVAVRLLGLSTDASNMAAAGLVVLAWALSFDKIARAPSWLRSTYSLLLANPARVPVVLSAGLLVAGIGALTSKAGQGFYVIPNVSNQHPLYGWMQQETAPNSVFLLDQCSSDRGFGTAINPQKIRLVGRRAVAASLDFPFLDKDMREWAERWRVLLRGCTVDSVDLTSLRELQDMQKQFPFDYVVRRNPLLGAPDATLVTTFRRTAHVEKVYVYRIGADDGVSALVRPSHLTTTETSAHDEFCSR